MKTFTKKLSKYENQAIANASVQKKYDGDACIQLEDNRPEAITQRKVQAMANDSTRQQVAIQKKGDNTELPDNIKTGIENLSGNSMNDVKINYSPEGKALQLKSKEGQSTKVDNAVNQKNELKSKNDHVIQKFEGDVEGTLWSLVQKVLKSSEFNDEISMENLIDLIYRNATNINPQQKSTGISMLANLQKYVPQAKQMGIFLKIENPNVDKVKEDYQDRRKGVEGPLWNERRISLNVDPEHVLDVMIDLSTYFSTGLKNVESIKCYASKEDQINKMDNVVIYAIEPIFKEGQKDNDLTYTNVKEIGTNYSGLLRSGRPAMSGETSFSGIGVGGGHGSLIHPRAEIIAQAINKWIKGGKTKNLTDLVKSAFDNAGYVGIVLHEEPSQK